ncbi:MAG: TetR/AcrR family transcriptional regulator [Solirubrobacterales bacterium]|nr:TetR/AcrR family transcriptional regulator [Solirubrobacterales bacterium]
MGRPALHTTEELIDAALALAAASGPDAVTLSAVGRVSGAPSGSVYHRFESRSALLGHLWLRTTTRFQAGFLEALAAGPALEGCNAAARFVVGWSRRHVDESQVLLRGAVDFAPQAWPAEVSRDVAARRGELESGLREAAERLSGSSAGALERVIFATVDIPSAAVRRHRASPGHRIPRSTEALVELAVRAILA